MNETAVHVGYRAGETVQLAFTVTDQDGTAANITGDTIRFVLARKAGDEPVASTEVSPPTATATVTDAPNGAYTVTVEHDVTVELLGTYRFESWLEDLSGNHSQPAHGFLTFEASVL